MRRRNASETRRCGPSSVLQRKPEFTEPRDGIPRKASTGGVSPMVKDNSEAERLVKEFRLRQQQSTVLGAG